MTVLQSAYLGSLQKTENNARQGGDARLARASGYLAAKA